MEVHCKDCGATIYCANKGQDLCVACLTKPNKREVNMTERTYAEKLCDVCGKSFTPKSARQRVCELCREGAEGPLQHAKPVDTTGAGSVQNTVDLIDNEAAKLLCKMIGIERLSMKDLAALMIKNMKEMGLTKEQIGILSRKAMEELCRK